MPLTLAEGLINEVKAYLTANLAAKLTALNAEYADGITLENAAAYYVSEKSLDAIPEYPALFVLAEQTTVENWQPTFTDAAHRFQVGAFILDQDEETLGRRLYRYGRAIWELLVEARETESLTFHLVDVPIVLDFSPLLRQGPSGPFLAGLQVTASARKQEDKAPHVAVAYDPACTLTMNITAVAFSAGYTSAGDPIAQFDVVQIDSELLLVANVLPSSNAITIGRGYGGTTPAAHSAGAAILKWGTV